jgi:hypothetical protein
MLLYIIGSVFIVQFVFNNKVNDVKTEVKNLARFNDVNFQRYIDMVTLAVITGAKELEDIDPGHPNARQLGEDVLFSKFKNDQVINSWLIFEPNAFDGRDAEHRGEYPGETSGRYMRSYTRQGTAYVESPDMDETLLDDMDSSYWYLVPKQRKDLFLDLAVDYAFSWDYGTGEGELNTLSLVSPMFRNGEFIGCVGQDILLADELLGPEMVVGAVSALFTPNGILRYGDVDAVGKSLEDLGFAEAGRIKEALSRGEALDLSAAYSPLLHSTAFAYFQPVRLADFNEAAYVYAAVPESKVWDAMTPILRMVLSTLGSSLVIFVLVLGYFFLRVSRPIHRLILACDAISRGKFDTEIIRFDTKDDIGFMTRSLYRMVEQFRIHITLRERSQNLLDMYIRLHRALYRSGSMEDVFDEIMPIVSDFLKVRKATLVYVAGETARVMAFFEPGTGIQRVEGEKFLHHRQVVGLVSGKKYLALNSNALRQQKVSFVGDEVPSLCILPFLAADELRAYLILEGDHETGPVVHNDAMLLFLAETLSFMFTQREVVGMRSSDTSARSAVAGSADGHDVARDGPQVKTPGPADDEPGRGGDLPVIEAARAIEGLDVDKGLFHSGGVQEQYGELLRISAKSFTAKVQTMRSHYTDDLPAFGIEIHGMKGALNAIGAGGLGEQAKELEFAAKAGDAGYCAREYPLFEEKLIAFTARLEAITRKKEIPSRGQGSVPALVAGLEQALEASRMFDSTGSGECIASLQGYSWEGCTGAPLSIAETLGRITDALEYMDYDAAEHEMIQLLDFLKSGGHAAPGA